MRRSIFALALLVVATSAAAGAAQAQRIEGAVAAHRLSYRYKDASVADRQSGMFLGASGAVSFGALRLGLSGITGQLAAGAALPARSLRVTTATLGLRAAQWLEVGIEAQARRDAADSVIVLQRLAGVFSRATAVFGTAGLEGTADLAFYPVKSATNTDPITVALRAGVAVRYAPYGKPIMVSLGYRMFRIDHRSVSGAPRLEQDEALVIELGLRR